MKVLILIISNDQNPVYAKHQKAWRTYMNTSHKIHSYFLQYHSGPTGIQGDTFYVNGEETYQNIIHKTLTAFEYFQNTPVSYDFIIRTNLSSVWNFTALLTYLETLPQTGVYSGKIGIHENSIPFISGSGFIMTPDVVKLLLDNRSLVESSKIIDDVDIGYALESLGGITRLEGSRTDFYSKTMANEYVYDPSVYHYRFKWHNISLRIEEGDCMLNLIKHFEQV
jgi:hypothetical protein